MVCLSWYDLFLPGDIKGFKITYGKFHHHSHTDNTDSRNMI